MPNRGHQTDGDGPALGRTARCPSYRPSRGWIAGSLVWFLVFCGFAMGRAATSPTEQFEAGNKLYEEGKYLDAAAVYQGLIASGKDSAALFFNLGNAFYKAGQLGHAIDAYTKAERLTPRDPDVRANLRFARAGRQGPSTPTGGVQSWLGRISLNEWSIASATTAWLWLLLLAGGQLRPMLFAGLRTATRVLGLAFVVISLCSFLAYRQSKNGPGAIVVVREAPVRNGPLDESQVAFNVFDGAELRVLDTKDQWLEVITDPRRTGWIKRDQVVLTN